MAIELLFVSAKTYYLLFTYINKMLKDLPNAEKLSSLAKSFYEEASKKGYGNLLVSELIKK